MVAEVRSLSEMTVDEILGWRASESPDAPFLYFGDETITYGHMQLRATLLASAMSRQGIEPGDRIAIASANSPDWVVTYFACCQLGAVLVTLNVAYREREFVYMLEQSGARWLICDESAGGFEFRPFLEQLGPRLPTVETVVFHGDPEATDSWHQLASGPDNGPDSSGSGGRKVVANPDSPAVILYTSGTTGDPKGATLTHHSLVASAMAQAERLEQAATDVTLGVMPFNHVGGLSCTIGATLVTGGAVALLPQFHPDLVAKVVPTREVTVFVGVPTMYQMLLSSETFAASDVASVRVCVIGGSNLEPELATRVRDRFNAPRMANLYGLSETSGACVISPASDSFDQVSTTIGTMLTGFHGRIIDDKGTPVGAGEVGELQVHGDCVAAGYWNAPEATAASFGPDGWLSTGDVGSMSPDGHITLLARKTEMYVRGGYNVYPAEVENVLAADPSVAMCAVIGVPDTKYGETGHAFVVAAPDQQIHVDALLASCTRQLAEYKIPAHIEVVDSLPMTPAGKIRKAQLRPH